MANTKTIALKLQLQITMPPWFRDHFLTLPDVAKTQGAIIIFFVQGTLLSGPSTHGRTQSSGHCISYQEVSTTQQFVEGSIHFADFEI